MSQASIYQKIKEASDTVKERGQISNGQGPRVGIILGSGLGGVADRAENKVVIPYSEIPHFHGTSIEGHAGTLILGTLSDVPVVFLQGRFHVYEGYPMSDVVFPTRTICSLGISNLILTNAAGGINSKFKPGEVMIIEDHINLMGDNPLKGKNIAELGPRFPDLTEAYHEPTNQIFETVAKEMKLKLHRGVYAGVLGPTYETPAEIRMLKTLGADAVGMSTVPEVIAANHLGVLSAGLSCITNLAAGTGKEKLTHDEVIENSKSAAQRIAELLFKSVPLIADRSLPQGREA